MDLYSAITGIEVNREALAAIVEAIGWTEVGDSASAAAALTPWGTAPVFAISWGTGYARSHFGWAADNTLLLLLHGLQLPEDLPAVLLQSGQVACAGAPGRIMSFTALIADGMAPAIDAAIVAKAAELGWTEVNLVVAGHSHGGALAMAYFTQRTAPVPAIVANVRTATFGAPRCLDPVGAANLPSNGVRVEAADDLIPRLPPFDWITGYPVIVLLPAFLQFYSHAGQGLGINSTGALMFLPPDSSAADPTLCGYLIGGAQLVFDSGPHLAGTYATRLRLSTSVPSGFNFANPFSGDPAMPVYKITTLMEQGPYGWSEVFYANTANAAAALTAATNPNLLNARRKLFGKPTFPQPSWFPQIVAVRANNIALQTDVALVQIPPATPVIAPNQPETSAANPNLCLLLKYRSVDGSGNVYQRNGYLRGIPDAISQYGGQYIPVGSFAADLSAWFAQLIASGLGLALPSKTNLRYRNLTMVNAAPNILVTTAVNHNFVTNDRVSITRVIPSGVISGDYFVSVVNATQFLILNRQLPAAITDAGYSQKLVPTFLTISEAQPTRITRRGTGRPFFSPRGRRSARTGI